MLTSFTVGGNSPSHTATPEQINVNDVLGNSSELLIRRSGRRESLQIGSLLQRIQDAIITVPPNNTRALLRFLDSDGVDLNMYMQTNPHPEAAIYYFPCQIEGGDELIGWGLARDAERGCETGLRVSRGQRNRVQAGQASLILWTAQVLKGLSPDGIAPDGIAPDGIAPDGITQGGITQGGITQGGIAPDGIAPDGIAQGAVRPVFYCSTAGTNDTIGFATAASGNPCTRALQQCQDSGGVDCAVVTMGSWWTSEASLYASLDCGEDVRPEASPPPVPVTEATTEAESAGGVVGNPSADDPAVDSPSGNSPSINSPFPDTLALPFSNWVEGTGQTLEAQIETALQQPPTSFCGVQVYRPDDFVIIPAPDDVVLGLGDDETLVQVRDTPDGLQVDVLKGAINVRSPYNTERDRQLVTAGQRYDQASTGNTITTFDQDAALTSVDMEVLCTFASTPSNSLNISACAEQNLLIPPNPDGSPSYAYCNREQASGGQAGDQRILQMSTSSGEIRLEYEAFDVPDRFQIFYEGREILDTGLISYSDTLVIPFSGRSGRVGVSVTGNPNIPTTQWNYTLYCP
ncbi:MAG: hypothetical protein F6K30_05865 [Cyanothece sp. SIO2G6]|nr:hypothetical protein [Cyanothece sp. SIO2G6]